jgi:hypothetical protein|tara:strand:+ start:5752 stop:6174 length:423 start_codon:yes stop_codon:yes gene_type:complete
MKKLFIFLLFAPLISLINCSKDDPQFDPISGVWLSESNTDNTDGDTVYYQYAHNFTDGQFGVKTKFSINSVENSISEKGGAWKNNDPNCKLEDCPGANSINQEYTINGEIVFIIFSNNFNSLTWNGVRFEKKDEIFYSDF